MSGSGTQSRPSVPSRPLRGDSSAPNAAIVQKCRDTRGLACEQWEKEINERVEGLYGL